MDADNKSLVQYVRRSLEEEEEFHFLRFESLQRLNIAQIQLDLARLKSKINREGSLSGNDGRALTERLRDFGQYLPQFCSKVLDSRAMLNALATAIRDYQDLRNKKAIDGAEKRKRKLLLQRFLHSPGDLTDPFESHYAFFEDAGIGGASIDPLRQAMMRTLPSRLTFSNKEKAERTKEYQDGRLPKEVSTSVDRLARFSVALVGGSFLIIPMFIMAINPDQTKSLLTVSLAVLSFILLLSFGIRVSNVETLVATATYSAVLVVFVGTSGGGGAATGTAVG